MKMLRVKRTTPFSAQCQFIVDLGENGVAQCESEAEHGIYFGNDETVKMVSLCVYHTIYQESIWRGGEE